MRAVEKEVCNALLNVCQSLAEQIVTDGEGVQHVIRLSVEQARIREEAIAGRARNRTFGAGQDGMGRRRSELGTHSGGSRRQLGVR